MLYSTYGFMNKSFGFLWMQKYKNFCLSFDRYMHIEKSVVDLFCIILIVLSSRIHMDLCTQVLDFCECRSTKFLCKFWWIYGHFTLYIQGTYSDMYWVCGKGKFYLYKKVQEDKRNGKKGYKWLFKKWMCG